MIILKLCIALVFAALSRHASQDQDDGEGCSDSDCEICKYYNAHSF